MTTDNKRLIAEARMFAEARGDRRDTTIVNRLADALEAAERKPVIDREALAKFIRDDAAYNYATILSDGEALALAEDILRFMSVEDKREAQAEALDAFAKTIDFDAIADEWSMDGTLSDHHWAAGNAAATVMFQAYKRAAEIREGRQ